MNVTAVKNAMMEEKAVTITKIAEMENFHDQAKSKNVIVGAEDQANTWCIFRG